MPRSAALAALALLAAAAPTAQAANAMAELKITNAASRIAICTVVVDGHSDTYLKIRPGKTHTAQYGARRQVQLVCERAAEYNWPIKLGVAYKLIDGAKRLELVEDAGSASAL
jgi:hypothetical protein